MKLFLQTHVLALMFQLSCWERREDMHNQGEPRQREESPNPDDNPEMNVVVFCGGHLKG